MSVIVNMQRMYTPTKTISMKKHPVKRENVHVRHKIKKTIIDVTVDVLISSGTHFIVNKFERLNYLKSHICTATLNDIYLINFANKNIYQDVIFTFLNNSISGLITYNDCFLWLPYIKYMTFYMFAFITITRFRYKMISVIENNIIEQRFQKWYTLSMVILFAINNIIGSFQHTFIGLLL